MKQSGVLIVTTSLRFTFKLVFISASTLIVYFADENKINNIDKNMSLNKLTDKIEHIYYNYLLAYWIRQCRQWKVL